MSSQTPSLWADAKPPPPKLEQKPTEKSATKPEQKPAGATAGRAYALALLPLLVIGLAFLWRRSPTAAIIVGVVLLLILLAIGLWRWIAPLMLGKAASGANRRSNATGPAGGRPASRPTGGPSRSPGATQPGGRPSRNWPWARSPSGGPNGRPPRGSADRAPNGSGRPGRAPRNPGRPGSPNGRPGNAGSPNDRPGRWPWSRRPRDTGSPGGSGGGRNPNGGRPPRSGGSPSGGNSPSGGGRKPPWWRRAGTPGGGGGDRSPGGGPGSPGGGGGKSRDRGGKPGPSRTRNDDSAAPSRRRRASRGAEDTPPPRLADRLGRAWRNAWSDGDGERKPARKEDRKPSADGGDTAKPTAEQATTQPPDQSPRRSLWSRLRRSGKPDSDGGGAQVPEQPATAPSGNRAAVGRGSGTSSAEDGLLAEADWHPSSNAPVTSSPKQPSTGHRLIADEAALMSGADVAGSEPVKDERKRNMAQATGNETSHRQTAAAYDGVSSDARVKATQAANKANQLASDAASAPTGVEAGSLRTESSKWRLVELARSLYAGRMAGRAAGSRAVSNK